MGENSVVPSPPTVWEGLLSSVLKAWVNLIIRERGLTASLAVSMPVFTLDVAEAILWKLSHFLLTCNLG